MTSSKLAFLALGITCLLFLIPWKSAPLPPQNQTPRSSALEFSSEPDAEEIIPVSRTEIEAPQFDSSTGMVWLGIGDAFNFGSEVVPRLELKAEEFDVYCQDIRHGVSLHCSVGAIPAHSPVASAGLPSTAASAAELITDAPQHLPKRDLMLTEKPSLALPGIGFVEAQNGDVYRLHLEQLQGHPDALQRRALVSFAKMRQVDGGGLLRLPTVDGVLAPDESTLLFLNRALTLGNSIPGDSFTSYIARKDHRTVAKLNGELTIDGEHLIVKDPVRSKVLVNNGSLILESGIEAGASVELSNGSGVAVGGDVRGKVATSGYGFMYIKGNVYGEMSHDSYATAIIEGDLVGTLHLRSYSDVLIRGRLLGSVDVKGSCWSTLYLESFISRQELLDMRGDFHQLTLHLAISDLAPGTHKDIGTWREVIVGDPVWRTFPR